MTDTPGSMKRGMKHLAPIIEERLKFLEEYGNDWADKPVHCPFLAKAVVLTVVHIERSSIMAVGRST